MCPHGDKIENRRYDLKAFKVLLGLGPLIIYSLCGSMMSARAAESENAVRGRQWAVLIGVEKYRIAPSLVFTVNDVKRLSDTLRRRGGFSESNMLEMTDIAANPRLQPSRENILTELPPWLEKIGQRDQLLVYFSGHGFRDKQTGELYLAPLDCDPNDPVKTGVSAQWLREQIAACKADFKLLILDACHAGSEKGDEEHVGVSAGELGESFKGLNGVVTIASSKDNEKSLVWGEMEQSLFSWWLNQGLKGHADRNGNANVTIDELYDFVYANVTATAKAKFDRRKPRCRIVRTGTTGVPVVIRLKPATLRETMEEMAEQLATAMRVKQLSKVGIVEFTTSTTDPKVSELLGGGLGLLGRLCAVELERQMEKNSSGNYNLVPHDALQKSLNQDNYQFKDLHTPAVKSLSVNGSTVPVIGVGTVCVRTGRVMTFQCNLVDTKTQEVLAEAGGTAILDESEWGMLGRRRSLDFRRSPAGFEVPGRAGIAPGTPSDRKDG